MTTINDILDPLPDKGRTQVLGVYLSGIASLHRAGHRASIKIKQKPRNNEAVDVVASDSNVSSEVDNLIECLAELFPRYDRYLPSVFQLYSRQLPLKSIEKKIYKKRKSEEKLLNACFETNDRFKVEENWNRFQVIDIKYDSAALQQLLSSPDEAIASGTLYKDCAATTVSLYTMTNGKKVIIKRYNSKGIFYSLTRSLISSRVRECWKGALLLDQISVNTPANLAMIECRTGPWIKTSYLVTEFVEGHSFIDIFEGDDQSQWREVARQVEDIFFSFRARRISHGDCKSLNFLVSNNSVFVIDLDSIQSHSSSLLFRRALQQDITRFERNWLVAPAAAQLFSPLIQSIRNSL
ncbi:hypothetical protein N9V90_01510 [Endozoicomonas sp.]|nr:hypothetical protein [Endozoicomonas sp.]